MNKAASYNKVSFIRLPPLQKKPGFTMLTKCGFVVQCLAFASAVVLIEGHSQYSFGYNINNANIEERDVLYPITRFAGMGYNLLRGNPEGDFERGGKDPGLRDTRWIFNLTYRMNKEGLYNGKSVQVPDQVEFQPTQTCASRSLTRAYSGQTSYQKELQRNVKFGLSGISLALTLQIIDFAFKLLHNAHLLICR